MARDHASMQPATVQHLWERYAEGIKPPVEVRAFDAV